MNCGRCIVAICAVLCRVVRQRSPEGGLAVYLWREFLMLRLNRRLLGVAAAVVFAASLAVTGATAASAAPASVSGTLSVQIVSTSATSPTESVITHGLFTDYGVDHPGNTVDKIVLQNGSFKVVHSAGV